MKRIRKALEFTKSGDAPAPTSRHGIARRQAWIATTEQHKAKRKAKRKMAKRSRAK